MNNFLKTRQEVDDCTQYLRDNNLIESGLSCKNYDIANVVRRLTNGDILDMGSDGSEILPNAVKLGIKGLKWGVDLAYAGNRAMEGDIVLLRGDLMHTGFEDNSFDIITCLSVVEHSVDFNKLAKECSRLLRKGGKLYVSFDYWPAKLNTKGILLYNLEWKVLSLDDVTVLINEFRNNGLDLTSNVDWTIQDAVINPTYCSPAPNISYTFGILEFKK